jgi:hypothetical protein
MITPEEITSRLRTLKYGEFLVLKLKAYYGNYYEVLTSLNTFKDKNNEDVLHFNYSRLEKGGEYTVLDSRIYLGKNEIFYKNVSYKIYLVKMVKV